jgi:hypothetical protein
MTLLKPLPKGKGSKILIWVYENLYFPDKMISKRNGKFKTKFPLWGTGGRSIPKGKGSKILISVSEHLYFLSRMISKRNWIFKSKFPFWGTEGRSIPKGKGSNILISVSEQLYFRSKMISKCNWISKSKFLRRGGDRGTLYFQREGEKWFYNWYANSIMHFLQMRRMIVT